MNMIRRVQGIVAIAALTVGLAGVGRAQSPPPEQKKAATEKKAEAAPKPAAEEAKKKGSGEGIQVHGHWTIEVKDPDGKVATHREFENSLTSGGASILADLLLGYAVNGGFSVSLNETPTGGGPVVGLAINSPVGVCNPVAGPCALTLASGPIPGGLSLSGQVTSSPTNPVPGGSITAVFTEALLCANTASPATPSTVTTVSPAGCTNPNTFGILTSTSPSPAVPVLAGQTVAVTVLITFM